MILPKVLVIGESNNAIGETSVCRALNLLNSKRAQAAIPDDFIGVIKTLDGPISVPRAIRITDCKYIRPYKSAWSKEGVKRRDNYTCVYCGDSRSSQLSVDHIIPRYRFDEISRKRNITYKLDSWENTVTACKACNQHKGSRLPEELGITIKGTIPINDLQRRWIRMCDKYLNETKQKHN